MMKNKYLSTALLFGALFGVYRNASALELPDQLGNHAVLQQNADVKLWGWAAPGATVIATPSWSGRKVSTQADGNGCWTLYVATPAGSYDKHSITFAEGKEKKTIDDILVGEVWFCSGQSNMEMPMQGFHAQPVEGAGADIARSGALRDKVRMAYVVRGDEYEPQQRIGGEWKVASPENTPAFGAQGFYFARELNSLLDVPVGILNVAYGGTMIEGWMPEDLLLKRGYDLEAARNEKDRFPAHYYTSKYNSMIVPLIGYTIRGFLWNQGESNLHNPQMYADLLSDMVARWRSDWGDTANELPFYQTEIPGFGYSDPDGIIAPLLREQQHKAAKMIPNSGIVCTNDLTYPHEVNDIHGSRKREIGERLAWQVAERQYGMRGMPWRHPEFQCMRQGENGTVRLTFSNVPVGFTPNGTDVVVGFEVAGADGVYHPAKAWTDWFTHEMILQSDEVPEIVNVRYCFKNFCPGNLKNTFGMPVIPFRTDSF